MNNNFKNVLEHLRKHAQDKTEQGKLFEKTMQRFFLTDILYKSRFKKVMLWKEYSKIPDFGIDLVAEEENGELCAIQCKFFKENSTINKNDLDSFLEASSRTEFKTKILVYTGGSFGQKVEDALKGHNCSVLSFEGLMNKQLDWKILADGLITIKKRDPFDPLAHQQYAISKVLKGFENHEKGQMIMACGTGKTFTALYIAEKISPKGTVLYLVPSISLLQQSMREWAEQRRLVHTYIGICSDTRTGRNDEDVSLTELEISVSTDSERIAKSVLTKVPGMRVIFSTYQSIKVIKEVQDKTGLEIDLVICDEAHRTTGINEDSDNSPFSAIHKKNFLKCKKKLFMTATPKIFAEASKTKAKDRGITIASMDDEFIFGPKFFTLSFSEAVDKGLLTDYKVIVLNINEEFVSKQLHQYLHNNAKELPLTDATKLLGCWKGLQNPQNLTKTDVYGLQRAIAFTNRILDSKRFEKHFGNIVEEALGTGEYKHPLKCEVNHIDGSQNALNRRKNINWLEESDLDETTCHILSNAKCLSEGIDVPALDAVIFLNPKNSIIDIMQAVGRVMRKSPNKETGYVILPVAIPVGMSAEDALDDGSLYETVWKVLAALRSHDNRLDIEINQIDLNKKLPNNVSWVGQDEGGKFVEVPKIGGMIGDMSVPASMICAKIVDKVGDRQYWEKWAKDVGNIVLRLSTRINNLLSDKNIRVEFDSFHNGLKGIINDSISETDAVDMLAQHIVTKPIFDTLFDNQFSKSNPVSQVMEEIVDTLSQKGLNAELDELQAFYDSVKKRVEGIRDGEGKQQVIKDLYGKFFTTAFPKEASRLGIVFTPIEIVDFILQSSNELLSQEFGKNIHDDDVDILDPFTGTGSFIARLLDDQMGLIDDKKIYHKFKNKLHANEIVLLAYYIAAINIEMTYFTRKKKYESFPGIVLTDTFSMSKQQGLDTYLFPALNKQLQKQKESKITLIVGNPPYSVGQSNYNDNNANVKHIQLDKRISETYAKKSKSGNINSLFDSYVKSIRWASDRIGDKGIIGFVTNGSFLQSASASGLRACLYEEFTSIYCLNLRGNQRTQGEISKKEGGKIFGQGSRAPVAITFLVKNPEKKGCKIFYKDIGDNLTRTDKLTIVKGSKSINGILDWKTIIPDKHHDWIDQREGDFDQFLPLGDKTVKKGNRGKSIFKLYSNGVSTSRDAWAINSSKKKLLENMQKTISHYKTVDLENPIMDKTKMKWSPGLKERLSNKKIEFNKNNVHVVNFRPFFKQWLYFDKIFNHRQAQIPKIFPQKETKNYVICVTGTSLSKDFSTVITKSIPDTQLVFNGMCFPRYTYEQNKKQDNILDSTLKSFQKHYSNSKITKDDIFYYVYGVLHSKEYCTKYAVNLKKQIPHIPMLKEFQKFAEAGRNLAELHLNYDTGKKYKLKYTYSKKFNKNNAEHFKVKKIKKVKNDKSILVYNEYIKIEGIPDDAHNYTINGRTPLEWIVDRYNVKTDPDSGITNDPNDWFENSKELIDLIERAVYVSVETGKIIKNLPQIYTTKRVL